MFGQIRNPAGETLDYTAVAGAGETGTPERVVVIGHGVTGNKDRPWAVALAAGLRAAGVASLRVSFAGNGDSQGRFQDATITKEVADLGAVLDVLGDRQIAYAGHSMGGAVGVIRAAADPRIRALVSLAGMVHTEDFAQRKFSGVEPDVGCMWDKPDCPLSSTFLADMRSVESVVALGASIAQPWLLVHGDADQVVPIQDSLDIRAAAGGVPELVTLGGVDHVFSDAGAEAMVAAVVPWLVATLGARSTAS